MKLLILGNGFDIAHGLPTKYSEYLEFVESFRSVIEKVRENRICGLNNIAKAKYEFMDKFIFENEFLCQEYEKMILNNFWIDYFLNRQLEGDGWIDFEKEISEVVKSIDVDFKNKDKTFSNSKFMVFSNESLNHFVEKYAINSKEFLVDTLAENLRRLIRSYEIYLSLYVNNIEVEKRNADVDSITPDYVLTFNYTNTFQRLYGYSDIQISHIHGVALKENKYINNSTNIVLGIDEYLEGDARNNEFMFIDFKKYFQRIIKGTDNRYQVWCEDMETKNEVPQEVYIFGHSLDCTDSDIIKRFLCIDHVLVTVYYLDKETHKRQIMNIVKMIGQDNLIRKVGGKNPTLRFVQQV